MLLVVVQLVPCFSRRLVPTTTHHKRLVYEALDAIVPLGRANWSNALDFTYRQLVHVRRPPVSICVFTQKGRLDSIPSNSIGRSVSLEGRSNLT